PDSAASVVGSPSSVVSANAGSGGAERCIITSSPPKAAQASMPAAMPASSGVRSGMRLRVDHPAKASAAASPAHHRKPPSPMAMIDLGAAMYSGHHSST